MAALGVGRDPVYRGGFIEGLTLTLAPWQDSGAGVVARIPLCQFRFLDVRGNLAALLASPHLARLRGLHLEMSYFGAEGAVALAQCPSLAGLRELGLRWNNLGSEGVQHLARSRHLAG